PRGYSQGLREPVTPSWPHRCISCHGTGYRDHVTTSADDREVDLTPGQRVAAGVLADIEAGLLKPGDRIPSEATHQAAYGVGRAGVRAGLERVREQGKIAIGQGSGSSVSGAGQRPMSASARLVHDSRGGIALGRL